ncbi:MAG: DUF1851 domain-containing protein [Cyclobacteriaceae bacterium]
MILESINKHWAWTRIVAEEIVSTNDFGNIIFRSSRGEFWRICPEQLYCKMIAVSREELETLRSTSEFSEEWEMEDLVVIAKSKSGSLEIGEKYCLKLPTVMGGEYSVDNLGKILQIDQIKYSGQLTQSIDDLPDGTKIEFNV